MYDGRVKSTAKGGSHGDIAAHSYGAGIEDQFAQMFCSALWRRVYRWQVVNGAPPTGDNGFGALAKRQLVATGKPFHAAKQCHLRTFKGLEIGQRRGNGARIEGDLKAGERKEGLHLRDKEELPADECVVERLYTEAVARQEERFFLGIPHGEGPFAVEAPLTFGAPLGVSCNNNLGIGVAVEMVAQSFESFSKFEEVVNLAIVADPVAPVAVSHGLMTRDRRVHHRQTSVAKSKTIAEVGSAAIGAAVIQHRDHRRYLILAGGRTFKPHYSYDTTHAVIYPCQKHY